MKKPVKKRRQWMLQEERILAEMWREGKSGSQIAKALNRSAAGVYCHIKKEHERMGIKQRPSNVPWQRAELNLVAREVELAITRSLAGLPIRQRASITQRMNHYLFGDAKRQKRRAAAERMQDVGGMASLHAPTAPRSQHTPKPRTSATAA